MKIIRCHDLPTFLSLATFMGALAAFAADDVREEFHQTYPLNEQGRVHLEVVGRWDRGSHRQPRQPDLLLVWESYRQRDSHG